MPFRLTSAFASFNGMVPEKFDAVNLSHNVEAEYGNQGTDFFCVPREGFGENILLVCFTKG